MKHIKLFEEFTLIKGLYTIKKEIPLEGSDKYREHYAPIPGAKSLYPPGISFKGAEQYLALVDYFQNLKFDGSKGDDQEKLKRIDELPHVFWYNQIEKKYFCNPITDAKLKLYLEEGKVTEFSDYFTDNPNFQGYHTGKQYGI